jgi:mannose-6-phosphate isomerase-like protein (cupin superfamily)
VAQAQVISGKVWGRTEVLADTPFFALHRLEIKPRSRCSLHMHRNKHNGFHVIAGTLLIEVHKGDYELIDLTRLGPGDTTSVKPGEYHRFISEEAHVTALEWYYPEALSEDIVRKDCGASHGGGTHPAANAAGRQAGARVRRASRGH